MTTGIPCTLWGQTFDVADHKKYNTQPEPIKTISVQSVDSEVH